MTTTTTSPAVGITVPAADFKEAIDRVKPAVHNFSASLETLRGVHIDVHDGVATFTATDLDLRLSQTIPVDSDVSFQTVVDKKVLDKFAIQAKKTKADVHVEPSGDDKTVLSADGIRFEVESMSADEFPASVGELEDTATFDLDALVHCLTAASPNEDRPILTGILVRTLEDGTSEYAATDSFRLQVVTSPVETGIDSPPAEGWHPTHERDVLIPAKAVEQIEKHLLRTRKDEHHSGVGEVAYNGRDMRLAFDNGFTVGTRLIEGDFPNYKNLLRDDKPNSRFDDVEEARSAIDKLIGMSKGVGFEVTPIRIEGAEGSDTLTLRMVGQDIGELSAEVGGTLPAELVAYNPKFLADVFTPRKDHKQLACNEFAAVDHLKPATFEDHVTYGDVVERDGRKVVGVTPGREVRRCHLIMPVRVT